MADWMAAASVYLSCFGLAVVSALVPWVNAEVIVLAFAAVAGSRGELVGVVLTMTAGQMVGKCVLYALARGGCHAQGKRRDHVEHWRRRLAASRRAPLLLVFVSSAVGVPPFYVVTLLAGACRVRFAGFVGAGTLGRLVRFGALVAVPRLALGGLG